MKKTTLMFDARGITAKPCGVRNVAENYLREFSHYFKIIALVNRDAVPHSDRQIYFAIAPRLCSRFSLLSDLWITFLVLRYRPHLFFSAHSFLPTLAFLPGCRVFICHDLFAALDKSFFAKRGKLAPLARLMFRLFSEISFFRASLIIAPSGVIRTSFNGLYSRAKKVCVVHNGVNIRDNACSLTGLSRRILFVGNFRTYKDFDTLYTAWGLLSHMSSVDDWELVVVTNESTDAVRQFVESRIMVNRIHFYSRVSDMELDTHRANSTICVVPSREEGFGIPLLEALSSDGIIIHSDIAVFQELTAGFDNSVIRSFPVGDPVQLANVLAGVIDEMNLKGLSTLHFNATRENREIIRNQYSWKSAASKVINEIRKC